MSEIENHCGKIQGLLNTQGSAERGNKIYNFREVGTDRDTLHSISLQPVGHNTAGVYIARAISNSTSQPLFYGGKPFILKLYNAEAAEGTLKNLDIKLSDALITTYFELKKDGSLQDYINQMCQQVERSTLPMEIADAFYQEHIPKGEIAWYLIAKCSTFNGCSNVLTRCEAEGLFHREQRSPVYRLALAMLCITLARHKEFAVQMYLKKHVTSGVLPGMISELKLSTNSCFLGSLVSDAVAMEMFEGITLLDAADNIEAKALFSQWSNHDLQKGLQDVVHLGSCLLPLGLQQFDCYPQNIFLRFNAELGYIATSWIDVESLKPVQGNTEAKQELVNIIHSLLQEQHSTPENHFRVSIDGFGPRLAFVKPDVDLEHDLCLALEKFYYGFCVDPQGQHAIRGECRMTYYDTNMYRRFRYDLLTTLLHWTIMQSACKAFNKKLHLVTAYLQLLRYIIDFHLEEHGTYCHCWVRATFGSIAELHGALDIEDNSEWDMAAREMVKPLFDCANKIEKLRSRAGNSTESKEYGSSRELSCDPCRRDLIENSLATNGIDTLHEELECLMLPVINNSSFACALADVENPNDKVTEFLSTVSIRVARASTFFQPLAGLPANTSRAQLVSKVESGTRAVCALDDWRIKVFPAF